MANEIRIAGKMRSATTEGILADAAEIQQGTGLTVEQAIKELDDKATTADSDISNLNANTGISDYEVFSDQKEYKAGTTVLKDGLLKTFIKDHAAGAWNPAEVEDGSLKKEVEKKISNLGETLSEELFINEITYTKKGNTVINANGEFVSYGGGIATDYIDIGNMKSVYIKNLITEISINIAVAFYDKEKTFIGSLPYAERNKVLSPLLVVFPENCKYFAVSKQSSTNIQNILIYSSIDTKAADSLTEVQNYIQYLKTLDLLQDDILLQSANLINPTRVEMLGTGWWVSDFIEVDNGETYYSNANYGFFTYDEQKNDITSSSPATSGSPIQNGIKFIRVKVGSSGNLTNKILAIEAANKLWFSKNNEKSSYAKKFNTYLIDVVDTEARNLLSKLMPHQGEGLFCVGDSYTLQGAYFSELLAVTGLTKIGDTGSDGNGQPLNLFPKNIIKYKEQIIQSKFVTILGGTNDYGHGSDTLGTINDCIKDEYTELKVPILKLNEEGYYVKDDSIDTSYKVLTEEEVSAGTNPSTLYAAIMTCINIIHSWDKNITVVLCSQPERLAYNGDVNPPLLRNGMNMDKIAKAMREIHEMFGIPFYDFHSNAWTIDQVSAYMNDQVLHPNDIGGQKLGRGLGMYINTL